LKFVEEMHGNKRNNGGFIRGRYEKGRLEEDLYLSDWTISIE